jgi:hypothetical protein
MHDPMTVAFDIGRFATIWHCDPESNGSDDSCGYSIPHLTERQRERLKAFAWSESHYPYFLRGESKEWRGSRSEAEAIYRGLLLHVADCIGVPFTFEQAARQAAIEIHNVDCIDRAGVLCFLPGWHSNFAEDRREDRERAFLDKISGIARRMLAARRPWYRHPKWHIHHWSLQVHAIQQFKRWAFTRCATCGKRFKYGESGIGTWSGRGPSWFRSETLTHMECDHGAKPQAAA